MLAIGRTLLTMSPGRTREAGDARLSCEEEIERELDMGRMRGDTSYAEERRSEGPSRITK